MPNYGSFGAGVSPDAFSAIREALTRRQAGGTPAALDQQSMASASPSVPAPNLTSGSSLPTRTSGQRSSLATPTQSAGAVGAEPVGGGAVANPEAEIILKAMDSRLKTISKLEMNQYQTG